MNNSSIGNRFFENLARIVKKLLNRRKKRIEIYFKSNTNYYKNKKQKVEGVPINLQSTNQPFYKLLIKKIDYIKNFNQKKGEKYKSF